MLKSRDVGMFQGQNRNIEYLCICLSVCRPKKSNKFIRIHHKIVFTAKRIFHIYNMICDDLIHIQEEDSIGFTIEKRSSQISSRTAPVY